MLRDKDIVLISSIDWNCVWQPPQEITLRLARAGNRVLFVENTGIRVPALRDLNRVRVRFRRWVKARRTGGLRQFTENVYICSPLVMPPFGPAWRRLINRHLFLPRIASAARRIGMCNPWLWTFLPTDSAHEIIKSLRTERSKVIYYCAADFAPLTPYADDLARSERGILEQCDAVFTTCSELMRHCGEWNKNVHLCPHGVDLAAFPPENKTSESVRVSPAFEQYRRNLPSLPRPIIGFIGGLHRFVDFHLVAEMARSRQNWTWIFVGPCDSTAAAFAGLPNVHLLGQQPHEDLVHYIRTFDVGIVPYLKNIYTRTVLPVKINEYLAVGKPVVSTDLPPVLEFDLMHRVLTVSDNQPVPFLRAIEQALGTAHDPGAIAQRREVASRYNWQATLEKMCSLIEAPL